MCVWKTLLRYLAVSICSPLGHRYKYIYIHIFKFMTCDFLFLFSNQRITLMHVLYNHNFVYRNAKEEALQVPCTSFVDLHGLGPAFKSCTSPELSFFAGSSNDVLLWPNCSNQQNRSLTARWKASTGPDENLEVKIDSMGLHGSWCCARIVWSTWTHACAITFWPKLFSCADPIECKTNQWFGHAT